MKIYGAKSGLSVTTGKRIRTQRLQRGWEQLFVARQLGISPSSYCKIESGITDLNFSRLDQIATIFGLNIVELLTDPSEIQVRELGKRFDENQQKLDRLKVLISLLEEHVAAKRPDA